MERVRSRVVVHGVAQGVFFRDTCRRTALDHDVAGWVRNLPDGTVEAAFEGAATAVAGMVEWAHHGPSAASVARVEVREERPEGCEGFEVRD
ncbi:acylphosphatase [Streptomyces sp. NBC_00211]|uniref:acylphosphatase n=1 Tax=Streptomyces sp. NBC_00211 TaxID=2975683 RepID=UPI003252BA09